MVFTTAPPKPTAEQSRGGPAWVDEQEMTFARGWLRVAKRQARSLSDADIRQLLLGMDVRDVMPALTLAAMFEEEDKVRGPLVFARSHGYVDGAGDLPEPPESTSFLKGSLSAHVAASERVKMVLSDMDRSTQVATQRAIEDYRRLAFDAAESTQKGVRTVVNRVLAGELELEDAQRIIRQCGVGLTDRYANAVMNRRQSVVERLVKQHPNWKISTIRGRANARAKEYAAELRRARALTVARTEVMTAYNTARLETWQEAWRSGEFTPGVKPLKEWVDFGAEDDICLDLSGTRVELDDSFAGLDAPPAHPNCRCEVALVSE